MVAARSSQPLRGRQSRQPVPRGSPSHQAARQGATGTLLAAAGCAVERRRPGMDRQVGRNIGRARGGLSPTAAVLTIAGVLSVAGLVARRYSPDPTHPRIQRWYKSLEKPPYKPPDPLF